MSTTANLTTSKGFYPSSLDTSTSSYNSASNTNNALNPHTNTTYAQFVLTTGSGATTRIVYNFDTSTIPANATINSVSCQARCYSSSTSTNYVRTRTVQLYTGTTAKGSSTTFSNSTTTYQTLTTGTWTRAELSNANIRLTGTRGSNSTTSTNYYFRFYGATLTVNYTYEGIVYEVNAFSNTDAATVEPTSSTAENGESKALAIYVNNVDDIIVLDNDEDVTDRLVKKEVSKNTSVTAIPASATTSSIQNGTQYAQYAVGKSAEDPYSSTSNMYAASGSTGYAEYSFDFSSIPEGATIDSIVVRAYGHRESSTTDSTHVAKIQLYSGTTTKGTAQEFTSTSNAMITLSSPGTWTRAELQNAKLRFTVGYYGGCLLGVTWVVNYTAQNTEAEYYYEYTIKNITTDHIIMINDAGPVEPPEEDPEYTYYPITISSINAKTTPSSGTTRVIEGSNQIITISPTDPKLTLALDNGVDITEKLSRQEASNTYTVTTAPNATYGFNLNNSTGYYVSTNNGVSKSASVARVNFTFDSDCLVTISYINYAEASYDYGMFGKLDTTVAVDGLTASSNSSSPSDSTSNYQLAMCSNSSSVQTITYNVPAGEHYVDIKYGKDDATDTNNDSLQWKITSIEATSAGGDYTYTLTNVQEKHSLIFVFGDVNYYFVTSTGTNCRLFPDGQQVKLEGQSYSITIIPDDYAAEVTLYDNTVDQTANLLKLDGTNKDGEPIVNYTYKITSVNAAHAINVVCASALTTIYLKISGDWVKCSEVYQKVSGEWVKVSDPTTLFNTSYNYINT